MNKSSIIGVYNASAQEISIDYNGFNYLVVFGEHVNGGYFAIINHSVCGDLAGLKDVGYNAEIPERFWRLLLQRLRRCDMPLQNIIFIYVFYRVCRLLWEAGTEGKGNER